MMKRRFLIIIIIICCFLVNTSIVYANEKDFDVQITPISKQVVYDNNFESEVEIIFKTKELYNEQVYLSYHIYGENKSEALVFENQRIPLVLDDEGVAKVKLLIALNEIAELKKERKLFIQYDLVDEKNVYWFSLNDKINFESFDTTYIHNTLKRITQSLKYEITSNPIIFSINILCCIVAVYTYYIIKKKELL